MNSSSLSRIVTKTNEEAMERKERQRSSVFLLIWLGFVFAFACFNILSYIFKCFILYFYHFFFSFSKEGWIYEGEEQLLRDWEVNGTGVNGVKFPKNQQKKILKRIAFVYSSD